MSESYVLSDWRQSDHNVRKLKRLNRSAQNKKRSKAQAPAQQRFPDLHAASVDKGFHSPVNRLELEDLLEQLVLPRKGKLSQQAKAAEITEEFVKARRQHSAIESAINALDTCPDHGIQGFKCYVALAVVWREMSTALAQSCGKWSKRVSSGKESTQTVKLLSSWLLR